MLLCDWLPPDFGAVGQYTLQRARYLKLRGHHVTVVGFSSIANRIDHEEGPDGRGSLRVVCVRRGSYDRSSLRQRAWWTFCANLALLAAAQPYLSAVDEIIFTGSPPFLLHFILPLHFRLRRRMVYRITDFHPECLIAEWNASGRSAPRWLRAIHRLTLFWRRRVGTIEIIGEDQAARLIEQGLGDVPTRTVRDPSPVRFTAEVVAAERPAELVGRRVLLYSGNFGVAHDHATIVEALAALERSAPGRAAFWLNAVGAKADVVEELLRGAGVCVHRSKPVPLAELPALMRAADAHLITLRDEFVGYVLPSKVYACIESGQPIVYIGSVQSDVHQLCLCGLPPTRYRQVSCGDVGRAVSALRELLIDRVQ